MASNRSNYTSPALRTSSGSASGSFSRANSYSISSASSIGTAKFSSLLSSSSAFSPSSYLSDKYSQTTTSNTTSGHQGLKTGPVPGVSKLPGSSDSGRSSGGNCSKLPTSSFLGTKKSTFGSTSTLTREKSASDGFGSSKPNATATNDTSKYHSSTAYSRPGTANCNGNSRTAVSSTGGGSRLDSNNSSGNFAKKSEPATSPYYASPQPNPGTRATTELKSSTANNSVTYGSIGSSAIASLRPTVQPRYGLKTTVGIHSTYTPSVSTYASSTPSSSTSSRHQRSDDDPSCLSKSKENKEALTGSLSSQVKDATASCQHGEMSHSSKMPATTPDGKLDQTRQNCRDSSKDANQTEKTLVQVNELMKAGSKPYVSSIPRPSTTVYSPFSSALSHFTGGGGDMNQKSAPSNCNKLSESSPKIKTLTGSSRRESSSDSENSSSSSSSDSIKNSGGREVGVKEETSPSSSSPSACQGVNYSSNCLNSGKPSSSSLARTTDAQQQAGQHNRRPPADPNKLSQSRSSSKSTIPTLCNKSPTPSPVVTKKRNSSTSTPPRKSSNSDAQCSGLPTPGDINKPGRRGSGTSSSSTTSSRSSSIDRSSSVSSKGQPNVQDDGDSSSASSSFAHPQSSPDKMSWIKRSPEPKRSLWWTASKSSTSSDSDNNICTILRNPNWSKNAKQDSDVVTTFKIQRPKLLAASDGLQQLDVTDNHDNENEHQPLGDRTSPDGTEIPSPQLTSPTEVVNRDKKDQLFISTDMTNIDDILGGVVLSPFLKQEENPVVQDLSDEEGEDAAKNQRNESDEGEADAGDDDDDGGASTGTCSSFEEVPIVKDSTKPRKCLSLPQEPINLERNEGPGPSTANNTTNSTAASSTAAKSLPCSSGISSALTTLDDATLQIYRDGDYGPYLDLEASINEQQEEFESFLTSRKNSIVLRGQLPVRVNAIIEKLLTADGRELRRALFSLKQIFQEDKDLVHEFVENGGLSCLIKVGSEADQNYQNYILRALGQIMLYIDGMYGVMRHNETVQWLYALVASKFRLVQKTALKLLLVFVDYVETNCLLLVEAISSVDSVRGVPPWANVMSLLHDDSGDTELLVYAMTLVNKVLNGIPDIDTYYDNVDALEEQGMATLVQKYMGKQCADLDLLQQLQIYEVVLKHEDGEQGIMLELDESMRQKLMNRKGYIELDGRNGKKGRRKSRRHSSNSLNLTPPTTPTGSGSPVTSSFHNPMVRRLSSADDSRRDSDEWSSSDVSSTHSASPAPSVTGSVMSSPIILNGFSQETYTNDVGITPGLRKRREQAEYQRSQSREFHGFEHLNLGSNSSHEPINSDPPLIPLGRSPSLKRDVHNVINSTLGSPEIKTRPWALPVYPNAVNGKSSDVSSGLSKEDSERDLLQLKRENTVKDITTKLASQSLMSPPEEVKAFSRTGDLSGIISKAKEGLAKSKSKADIKPTPSSDSNGPSTANAHSIDTKKSDNELHWDFLVSNLNRPLEICDLDFTELKSEDDLDVISPHTISQLCNMSMNQGIPAGPPPPLPNGFGPPPPPPSGMKFPAPPKNPPVPPVFGIALKSQPSLNSTEALVSKHNSKKTKKTVKLFWKEVREDPVPVLKVKDIGSIWEELQPIPLDTQKLEHLFESRAKDVITKKQQDVNKFKEVVVLDPKRSNAINIGMTKLAPPRTIKTAIMKMDSTIINREGIEKLLTMLPTDEERAKIQEAQFANPDTPLGSAEQFLLTLASISELTARLKLWAFKLDYENLEKEVGEPLMDLKLGIEALQSNKTFRCILTTLLCIGNFLNGGDAKGFQIEYLAKVPEVKDTVHKHSLLHHLCHTVIEKFPESTDLYSEIGPVTRASRVDFEELAGNLVKMEADCKASWDYLKLIAKHDGPTNMKLKMSEFLADCAERIIVLGIINRRVMNRFHKFLLWLGVSAHQVPTTKPHYLFKIISEFALEYRTTRERVLQQLQKKANHRERNKTRGKLITEQIIYKTKEDRADAELRQVLNTSNDAGDELAKGSSLTWTRRSKTPISNTSNVIQNNFQNKAATLSRTGGLAGDGHDEILESLVKTATSTPATRMAPRERKRNNSRYADRKSLRRTLRHGLTDEERNLLASFMANGHSFSPEPAYT